MWAIKHFDKEILFEFANPVVNTTLCDQEINLVGIDIPPKILGTELIHNLIQKDILSIPLCISKFQIDILNQGFLLRGVFTFAKTIKYDLTGWIIFNPNFQIKYIKGEISFPDYSTRENCRVHETMAPKKNTQALNPQKSQSNQAFSPQKMLWSQQVELEEKARLHSSNLMPNKMMTLYYDPSDPSNLVKAT